MNLKDTSEEIKQTYALRKFNIGDVVVSSLTQHNNRVGIIVGYFSSKLLDYLVDFIDDSFELPERLLEHTSQITPKLKEEVEKLKLLDSARLFNMGDTVIITNEPYEKPANCRGIISGFYFNFPRYHADNKWFGGKKEQWVYNVNRLWCGGTTHEENLKSIEL